MNAWDTTPKVVLCLADSTREARAAIIWHHFDVQTVAWVRRGMGGMLEVFEFEQSAPHSIPATLRRLPSDVAVLQAMRSAGNTGISTMAFLLNVNGSQMDTLSEFLDEDRVDGQPLPDSAAEKALQRYAKEIIKRPRSRVRSQVAEVLDWMKQGKRTADIVHDLVTSGISERTAYRRISDAQALLNDEMTHGPPEQDSEMNLEGPT